MYSEVVVRIMPETEQQDKTLSEVVVKEAVGKGLDSPLRDSILEAVEETEGAESSRRLPLAGVVFGLGAALGYFAGQQSEDLTDRSIGEIDETDVVEEVVGGDDEDEEDEETELVDTEEEESTDDDETDGGSSLLSRVLLVGGVVVAIALLRRRLGGDEEDEWEPIEEFEPATDVGADESETAEEEGEAETEFGADEDEETAETDETEE